MRLAATITLLACAAPLSAQQALPPPLVAQPVTNEYFGQKVEDRFRFIEQMDPATLAWMRAQAAVTRRTLDSIEPRAALAERMNRFGGAFGSQSAPNMPAIVCSSASGSPVPTNTG